MTAALIHCLSRAAPSVKPFGCPHNRLILYQEISDGEMLLRGASQYCHRSPLSVHTHGPTVSFAFGPLKPG